MTIKIIYNEIKTWVRTIIYRFKKKKNKTISVEEQREKLREKLKGKSPQELKKMEKNLENMKLRGHHVLCVKCGKPGGKLGNLVVIINKDGKKGYIHEGCK